MRQQIFNQTSVLNTVRKILFGQISYKQAFWSNTIINPLEPPHASYINYSS